MDKLQLVESAKELVANSNIGKALDLVKNFLQSDRKFRVLYDESLRVLAFYNKTKREEENELISFDNAKISYNQITDRLLALLGYIENNDLNPEALQTPASPMQLYYQSHKWQVLTVIPTLLIAIALLVWVLKNGNGQGDEEDPSISLEDCPFEAISDFNIMLLHFYLPGGDNLKPEGLIAEQLESFCTENRIGAAIEIMQKPKQPDRLIDYPAADELGKLCQAKMVIWGRAEKSGATAEIKTRYRYLGDQGAIAFNQIKWQGENQIGGEKTLSSLVSQGEIFDDIEKVILLVQGILASDANNPELALANLENLETKDSTAILLKGMVQAENHLKQGDGDKAIAAYDDVLNTHPNYWLARNNRGLLEMQEGDNLNAIEDLSAALEKRPEDTDMLLALGKAYENSEQLYPAKAAYEKAISQKSARTPEATKLLEATQIKINRQEKVIQQVEKKDVTSRTMRDTMALLDAHRNLGQNDLSTNLISSTRVIRPVDPALVARQVETLLRENKKEEAQKVIDDAVKNGLKKEEIINNSQGSSVKKFVLKRF